jgi:hypothetical protein
MYFRKSVISVGIDFESLDRRHQQTTVKDKNDLPALNIIRKRFGIPFDCDLLALLYFLFTEVVKDVGEGSAILSDIFLCAVG